MQQLLFLLLFLFVNVIVYSWRVLSVVLKVEIAWLLTFHSSDIILVELFSAIDVQ